MDAVIADLLASPTQSLSQIISVLTIVGVIYLGRWTIQVYVPGQQKMYQSALDRLVQDAKDDRERMEAANTKQIDIIMTTSRQTYEKLAEDWKLAHDVYRRLIDKLDSQAISQGALCDLIHSLADQLSKLQETLERMEHTCAK